LFNLFERLKNLLEKEEETHNIVMAKYTQTPKISKLGSFGEQT